MDSDTSPYAHASQIFMERLRQSGLEDEKPITDPVHIDRATASLIHPPFEAGGHPIAIALAAPNRRIPLISNERLDRAVLQERDPISLIIPHISLISSICFIYVHTIRNKNYLITGPGFKPFYNDEKITKVLSFLNNAVNTGYSARSCVKAIGRIAASNYVPSYKKRKYYST